MQDSNHYFENCRRSCRDTNSTINCDGRADDMAKSKAIHLSPLHGGGKIRSVPNSVDPDELAKR